MTRIRIVYQLFEETPEAYDAMDEVLADDGWEREGWCEPPAVPRRKPQDSEDASKDESSSPLARSAQKDFFQDLPELAGKGHHPGLLATMVPSLARKAGVKLKTMSVIHMRPAPDSPWPPAPAPLPLGQSGLPADKESDEGAWHGLLWFGIIVAAVFAALFLLKLS